MFKKNFATALLVFAAVGAVQAQSTTSSNILTGVSPDPNEYLGSAAGNIYNLVFKTVGNERMRLTTAGSLGIGLTAPLTKVHINGNFLVANTTGVPASAAYIRGNSAFSTTSLPDYTWYSNTNTGIFHPASNNIGITIGGGEAMRFTSNRYVGIGTSAPESRFHIKDGAIKLTGSIPGGGGPMILFGGDASASPNPIGPNGEWGIEYTTAPATGGLNFFRPFLATSSDVNNLNYKLFLCNNNNIGINTSTPTAQLTVNGKTLIGDPGISTASNNYLLFVEKGILTEKVKVALSSTADWSDYVFDKSYELMPLTKVKSFVTANRHLPGVPSAQELVDDNGYDLGKMDAKLLEKIEELTLHLIQLSEENEALKKRMETLESGK